MRQNPRKDNMIFLNNKIYRKFSKVFILKINFVDFQYFRFFVVAKSCTKRQHMCDGSVYNQTIYQKMRALLTRNALT